MTRHAGLCLTLVATLLSSSLAAPPDATKQLKGALARIANEEEVSSEDPRLAGLGEAIISVGALDDKKAAKMLMGLLQATFPSATVEVFVAESARTALIGMSSAEARDEVKKALEKKGKKTPLLALGLAEVVAGWREPASVAPLAQLLEHRDQRVVIGGARGLGQLGLKESVRPLIEKFDHWLERGGQPIEAIGNALFDITGQAFKTQEDWAKWWDGEEATWDPAKRTAGSTRERSFQREAPPSMFDEVEITSRRVVIVMDTSGSMHIRNFVPGEDEEVPQEQSGSTSTGDGKGGQSLGGGPNLPAGDPNAPGYEKKACTFSQCPGARGTGPECPSDENLPTYYQRMDRLARQTIKVVRRFDPSVKFNIVSFSSDARSWRGKALVAADGKNKRTAIEWLGSLRPDGTTRAKKALEKAFTFEEADTIVFVTDGAPTDHKGKPLEASGWRRLLDHVKRLNRLRQVKIDVIGIAEGDGPFARTLARENNGDYATVP